jgi:hypothetical protein
MRQLSAIENTCTIFQFELYGGGGKKKKKDTLALGEWIGGRPRLALPLLVLLLFSPPHENRLDEGWRLGLGGEVQELLARFPHGCHRRGEARPSGQRGPSNLDGPAGREEA